MIRLYNLRKYDPTHMLKSRQFLFEFLRLTKDFWFSDKKLKIRTTVFLLVLLTIGQIIMAVLLTKWSADLFNALEQHSMHDLIRQIGILSILVIVHMALTGSHLSVKRNLMVSWREWLTDYVLSRWMNSGRHYLISPMPIEHDNPDGRIAEDCRVATEDAVSLGHSLFYSILMLVSFTKVLWSLSGVVTLDLGVVKIPIYGYLVWIAIVYSMLGSYLGWLISKPLTGATNKRQSAEAKFRASLLEANENSQAIALIHAENYERQQFRELFHKIQEMWDEQTKGWRNILMFGTGYGHFSMAFPILISAPRYILGNITLGTLMQSAQAFQHMTSALSWPVNSAGSIAEWRASVERVLSLLQAIESVEEEIAKPDRCIQVKSAEREALIFHDLTICKYNGLVLTEIINMEIEKGHRVLITGDTFTGAKLFRAIAQIRPWGSGTILLPSKGRLFFMPPRPRLPTGTLRNTICYPFVRRVFTDDQIRQALQLAGLGSLCEQLDKHENWGHTLNGAEQQRLGMVRLLINQPHWIFLQEAFNSLEAEEEERMLQLISQQLPEATILAISHMPNGASFYNRSLAL